MEAGNAGAPGSPAKSQDLPVKGEDTPAAPEAVSAADVPDPDEDDLDDLDDMLDDFSQVKLDPKQATAASGPGRPDNVASSSIPAPSQAPAAVPDTASTKEPELSIPGLDDFSEEEFQKQLQAGMAELMNDMDSSPDMQAQFENIFKGLAGGAAAEGIAGEAGGAGGASTAAQGGAPDFSQGGDSFQETIRRTMERMQTSGDQATAAAAANDGIDNDFIAEMMKAMKDMPSGGDGNEEDFTKMLMGMMEQLTNKEILYEPMRELNEKYPDWMTKNRPGLSEDDVKRYEEQQRLVAEMVTKFEEPTYSDSNTKDREYIVDRMQKMQSAGSPPPDLVGDMPSAKEMFDAPDDGCAPQ